MSAFLDGEFPTTRNAEIIEAIFLDDDLRIPFKAYYDQMCAIRRAYDEYSDEPVALELAAIVRRGATTDD